MRITDMDQAEYEREQQKQLARSVHDYGQMHATAARSSAATWEQWAAELSVLAANVPTVVGPPRAMDELGENSGVPTGARHVDPARLRALLDRVVADADAMAAALKRAARLVDVRTKVTVLDLEEASRG